MSEGKVKIAFFISIATAIILTAFFTIPAWASGEITVIDPIGTGWSSVDSAGVEITVGGSYDAIFEWGTETGVYSSGNVSFLTEGGTCGYCGFSLGTSLENGSYYARARLRDSGGGTLYTSEEVYFEVSGGGGGEESIEIYSPADESTSNGAFWNWQVNISAEPLTGDDWYFITVDYNNGENSFQSNTFTHGDYGMALGVPTGFPNGYRLEEGTWFAQSFMYPAPGGEIDGHAITSSEEITFYVVYDDAPPEVDCGETDFVCKIQNWFANKLGDILAGLFAPTPTVVNKFGNLFDQIANKVPFGYFNLVKTEITNVFEGKGNYELPEMEFFDDLKDTLAVIFWIMFAVWLIKRFGQIDV